MYNANIGGINEMCVFDLISNFWNKTMAGRRVDDPVLPYRSGGSSASCAGETGKKRRIDARKTQKGTEPTHAKIFTFFKPVEDGTRNEPRDATREADVYELDPRGYHLSRDTNPLSGNAGEPKTEIIPNITPSIVHYHFTHCYKEQNGFNIIFKQINILSEIQQVLYENGVFYDVVVEAEEFPRPDEEETEDYEDDHGAALRGMETQLSDLERNIEDMGRAMDSIDTTDAARDEHENGQDLSCVKRILSDRRAKLERKFARLVDQYENALIVRKDRETDTNNCGERVFDAIEPKKRQVAVNLKTVNVVKELSKTIITLLDKTTKYKSRQSSIPAGLTQNEFFSVAPLLSEIMKAMEHDETSQTQISTADAKGNNKTKPASKMERMEALLKRIVSEDVAERASQNCSLVAVTSKDGQRTHNLENRKRKRDEVDPSQHKT
jgi:hypothetical protein